MYSVVAAVPPPKLTITVILSVFIVIVPVGVVDGPGTVAVTVVVPTGTVPSKNPVPSPVVAPPGTAINWFKLSFRLLTWPVKCQPSEPIPKTSFGLALRKEVVGILYVSPTTAFSLASPAGGSKTRLSNVGAIGAGYAGLKIKFVVSYATIILPSGCVG